MAFKVISKETIKVRVKFEIPTDVGTKPQRGDLVVEFVRRPVSEQKEFLQELSDNRDTGLLSDDMVLYDDIVNIEGVQDEKGVAIEYVKETTLPMLLEMDFVRRALLKYWSELNFGVDLLAAVTQKNS